MKAIVCTELGPADRLRVEELPDPVPGSGEVVVDVAVAGLNFPDTLIIQGAYQFQPDLPFVPGAEAAGRVSAVGEGVEGVAIGDRVIALGLHGAFAEKWVVPADGLIPIPDVMSDEQAAGFGLTYGTSYHALKDRARLQPGETLVVLGAAGGVGSAAVEIGKAMGARVIAAASTDEKLRFCRELGADDLINYATEDLKNRMRELTGGEGADVVYDPVGGDLSEPALRSTGFGGRFLVIGFASGEIPSIPLNLPLLKVNSIVGVFWGSWSRRQPDASRRNFSELRQMVEEGRLSPRVSQVFSFDDRVEAFTTLTARRAVGKVLLRP